jgi:PAS domain S-box-containing protein
MNLKSQALNTRKAGLLVSALVFVLGFLFLLLNFRASQFLQRASYDWSFELTHFAAPNIDGSGVVIVYLDDDSIKELNSNEAVFMDRKHHAKLLERLKQEGARAVVMDMIFDHQTTEASDLAFQQALKASGNTVLGMELDLEQAQRTKGGYWETRTLNQPLPRFATNCAALGMTQLGSDDDFLVRRHKHAFYDGGSILPPSLSWATARLINLPWAQSLTEQSRDHWIYYYGPPLTIPFVTYKQAYYGQTAPGFFHNKIVFIGARPRTGVLAERRDELRNPFYASVYVFMPAVEVHATEFLNLTRKDWLTRPAFLIEAGIFAVAAVVAGFTLLRFRLSIATLLSLGGMLVAILIAQTLFAEFHVWFPWLIIVVVQIPAALLCAILYRSLEWYFQRRKLEQEQKEANKRIRHQAALLDKAQDAIIEHDLNWVTVYWNKSAEELYGWTFEEVRTKNLMSEVFKADADKSREALQEALSKGEWSGEVKQFNRHGKQLIVQSRWTLVRDDEGKPKSVFVINTDITEKKSLEAQFLRTQRMESIGTLAGGIAHDLNNVLSPIVLGVELMKMQAKDEFSLKTLNTMASSARRGSDMVKQVLTFARGHEGEKSVLQSSHLIKEMQKIIKETFPRSLVYRGLIKDNLWPIMGDATQIHQILLNLCVNARDAMPDGGDLTIEAGNVELSKEAAARYVGAVPGNYVVLSVTDTGTGIPPEIVDKIFEPFFTTKEIGKGTGLGLSTVMSIIKSHGGFLDLKSEVGKGTSFNVYFPAAEGASVSKSDAINPAELRGDGEHLMIVDDETSVLDLTKSMLMQNGYRVVTAIHGADAVALYPQYREQVKLVIMDMMMPVMDGPKAIRILKEQNPNLRFIAISGLMQAEALRDQLGDNSIVFVPKPFTTERLLKAVRDLLNDKARSSSVNTR